MVTIVKTYRFMQNMVGLLMSTMACSVQKLVELSMLVIGHLQTTAFFKSMPSDNPIAAVHRKAKWAGNSESSA